MDAPAPRRTSNPTLVHGVGAACVLLLALALGVSSCAKPQTNEFAFVHEPLVGMHAIATCSGCHGQDLYADVPEACVACHLEDRPPDHYPGECEECHTPRGWGVGTVDHDFFPLTFGHDGPTCEDCHGTAPYDQASPVCASCHSRPAGHFEGACEDCHNTRDWDEADFDHDDFFPTPHEGVSACGDCHPGSNYQVFTCTDCHAHRRNDMDDEHDDVGGYSYNSAACLDCHPDGEEDD